MTREYRKPLPYYRWYVRDHRAHRIGRTLSCFEEGMLRRLLDEQWEKGAIPADPVKLAEIVGESVGVVAQAWEKLQKFFDDMPGMEGVFVQNERLEMERTEADSLRAKRSAAGQKGGRPRKQEKATDSNRFLPQPSLELLEGKSLRGSDMSNHAKANESNEKQPSQESSSSSRAEKSRREALDVPCMCGGVDGFHKIECPVGRMLGSPLAAREPMREVAS